MRMNKNQTNSRKYSGQTKEERIAQRRKTFIEAGLQIIGTEGYRAATLRRLCKEAGLTERYYYESFSGSEDVLIAVFEFCNSRIQSHVFSAITQVGETADLAELMYRVLDSFFKEIEDPRVARVAMLEFIGVSPKIDKLNEQFNNTIADLLLLLARNAHPSWEVSNEEGRLLGISLLGAVRQVAMSWFLSDYKLPREVVTKTSVKVSLGINKQIEHELKQIKNS